jgi:AMMECR1 domain-containing protein
VEISVLTPLKRIRDRSGYRLHEHGAHLELGTRRSLLLPQVSRARDWTADRFWDALAQKASLQPDVYDNPDVRLHVFRAQVIQ